jgi:hypothetical protein
LTRGGNNSANCGVLGSSGLNKANRTLRLALPSFFRHLIILLSAGKQLGCYTLHTRHHAVSTPLQQREGICAHVNPRTEFHPFGFNSH